MSSTIEGLPPRITMAEAAARHNVHYSTIRRWVASGQLPAYRTGKRAIRIDPDDLDKVARRIASAGDAA